MINLFNSNSGGIKVFRPHYVRIWIMNFRSDIDIPEWIWVYAEIVRIRRLAFSIFSEIPPNPKGLEII